ncbi:phosphatidic acid phosphatase [Angomonas deanei]|uniref:PAP2 superfamily, putative n=1 Tax=Angomonas deanei TaxID=59799 RepID=A0A7G2CV02_9TRYP|nr:phosphatidic acid phosphatase [Angomonas deanei]CAD2222253.1 PAP2 superfamily, putative [Angomonas deanei]|eukprot:EPY41419.1 phosphatidic acid phosphatase [Angomonas deanei]
MSGCCKAFWKHFLLWRIPDYIAIIILAIVAAVVGAKVRPHCRDFEFTDATINHPMMGNTFPMYSVAIAVVFVAVIYFIGEPVTRCHRKEGKTNLFLHLNGWVLAHAYSILLAFAIVNISKVYAGRLRPHFIALLAEEGITQENFSSFTHDQICDAAREGRLSFPSGHSGTAFSGFVPPCLYLLGLFRVLKGGRFWLATIAMLPLILPITVAVSRTLDYHHNFDDIVTGSMIGAVCGVLAVALSFRPAVSGEWTLRDHPAENAPRPKETMSDNEEV